MASNFEEVLKNQPPYRSQQVKQALFKDLVENWSQAIFLPLALREKLNKEYPIPIQAKAFISQDKNTIKALIALKDGLKIESVLMRYEGGRKTVCVSSQVGCSLNCKFCATGKMGFKRNLESQEIINQVLFFARFLKKENLGKITNIVFMGMGEPFLNYENVLGAIRILNDKDGFNLGARKFSISTAGIVKGIDKLANEKLEVNLAISLHAPDNDLRSQLMPVNKKYPIEKILKAVDSYIQKTNRKVMFEYIMIDGLNDFDECALKLAKIMKKKLYMVNLISYNPTDTFEPSTQERIKRFKDILMKKGINVTQRFSFGQDIKASCGQLVVI